MKLHFTLPTFVLGVATAAALAACGSSNQASTVATTPTVPSHVTTGITTSPPVTITQPRTTPTTTSPPATRTAPAPAFVQTQPPPGTELAAAVAIVNRAGYTANDTATYKPSQTLRVLIGQRAHGSGRDEWAFFFVNNRYIGTDTIGPSASLAVVSQNDTAVTLRYGIYRSGDTSPSSYSTVQFALNNGKLTALDPIPSVASRR